MDWIKINGCDFNVKVVATLSFEGFKNEFKYSFCNSRLDEELKNVYDQIIAVSKPKEDVIITKDKEESLNVARKGSRVGSTSISRK